MGLFNNLQRSRGAMRLFIIQLVCCLAWLSTFAFAQFDISEGITGSINFPAQGVTCVANLAVFVTSLIRGRLDLEIGARDVLDFIASPKLKNIEGINDGNGLITVKEDENVQTSSTRGGSETGNTSGTVRDAPKPNLESADVVMLSHGTPNWSMRQFMKSNAPIVDSILLQFLTYKAAKDDLKVKGEVNLEMFECSEHRCDCIVFWTMKEISNMLARRMPGTLRRLSDSLCLLPCLTCHRNGCNHGRLAKIEAEETDGLRQTEGSLVCGILQDINAGSITAREPICICIPMHDASSDVWTELLLRSLRSKDAENRGVRVMASEALEGYLAGRRGGRKESVVYNTVSFMVARLTEALVNLALTFWFRVDGFSSALLARRTIRDYLVDSKGSGLAANAFLTKAEVHSSNTQVCQVLTFRGNVLGIRNLSFIVGCVNLMSAIGWAVLIAMEGRADTSPPLSMPIVLVIIGTTGIVFGMDVASINIFDFRGYLALALVILSPIPLLILLPFLPLLWRFKVRPFTEFKDTSLILFLTALGLETVFIVSGSAVAGILGIKGFGRRIYGIVQILVWVKWAVGSYILDIDISQEFMGRNPHTWKILIYSSAFLLNAVLAGVRCKWEPWPWKKHHIKPVS